MLTITDLSARIAGRLLIDHASLSLPGGAKVGLVGRNGAGKSTLFRIITGDLSAETGDVSLPKGARIGQVAQEAPGSDEPLIDIVLSADKERCALLEEAETALDANRIAEIQTRLADIGAHSAEARAASILAGLGFDADAQKRPASSFSGGWRMRVALASVLFSEPDLLLLDEPTNYLDLEGTLWLEDYVRRYPHMVVIISHDRDLLNNAVSAIVHLDQKKLTFYRGGYDQFERQRAEAMELQSKARARQEAQRRHMEAFVERFRAKATKARQAQSRLKALEKMKPIAAVIEDNVQPIRFPDPAKRIASPIIAADGVSVGYVPETPVLSRVTFRVDADDRIALLGANGNGKSTLAKLLAGRLTPQSGTMTVAPGLNVGFFAQHQLDDLIPEQSAVDHVRRLMQTDGEARVRARVAQMGLATEKMDTAAKDLSGGEKARLLMGLASFHAPSLLILDEPTNHLDIDSREALIQALNDFSGAVILIAHDRHLIEATVDRLWLVADGGVRSFDGDLDEYRALILTGRGGPKNDPRESRPEGERDFKADQRREAAQRRARLKPLQKKIKEIEALVERLQNRIKAIETQLSDPALYSKDPSTAARLAKERSEIADELGRHEETWLALSEDYEQAAAG